MTLECSVILSPCHLVILSGMSLTQQQLEAIVDRAFPGERLTESRAVGDDRYALAPGARLEGHAIVEERESTSVLPPGVVATVDEYANLVVTVTAA